MSLLKHEIALQAQGHKIICGIDEVGIGSIAGPLVACAVALDVSRANQIRIGRYKINDSKILPRRIRKGLYPRILRVSYAVGIGIVDVHEINHVRNMRKSGYIARYRAVENLALSYKNQGKRHCHIYWHPKDQNINYAQKFHIYYCPIFPHYILVDGPFGMPEIRGVPVKSLIGGDGRSISIASASIVAKVYRDRLMINMSKLYPSYGFERNVGYATAHHKTALRKYGVTPYHRMYFEGVHSQLAKTGAELDEHTNHLDNTFVDKDQLKFEFT